jgi:hypothetical protein
MILLGMMIGLFVKFLSTNNRPMTKTYKFIFVNNEIFAAREAQGKYHFKGDTYYHMHNGYLTYAIIKASSEKEAHANAERLIVEIIKTST